MLLDERCDVMLPNSMQCPNQVVPGGKVCLLHEQMTAGLNVDETNVNTNTLPEQNKPNTPEG
jgi:hypothetical protein